MNRNDRTLLKEALVAYERLTMSGRALTASQARKRAALLQELQALQALTGTRKGAVKKARQLVDGIDPRSRPSRKARYQGLASMAPRAARPAKFSAPRVIRVIPSAIESNRRAH
jgi:hypothetical protein